MRSKLCEGYLLPFVKAIKLLRLSRLHNLKATKARIKKWPESSQIGGRLKAALTAVRLCLPKVTELDHRVKVGCSKICMYEGNQVIKLAELCSCVGTTIFWRGALIEARDLCFGPP